MHPEEKIHPTETQSEETQSPTSTQVNQQKPNLNTNHKRKMPFIFVMVFLAGAVAYATVAGVHQLINGGTLNQEEEIASQTAVTPSEPKNSLQSEEPQTVNEEELAKYVDPKDCTETEKYSDLKRYSTLLRVDSISVYDGLVVKGSSYGGPMHWDVLPDVVDYECKEIKLTDITLGDRVNVYTNADALPAVAVKEVQVVQKVNK